MPDFIETNTRLGAYEAAVRERLRTFDHDRENVVARLWAQDASLWSDDRDTQQKILNRLGWLNSALVMDERQAELHCVQEMPYRDVVLLGMGGSSLAPEVFQRVFGNAGGSPRLHVLDNTTPGALRHLESQLDLAKTVFIIASKSGTTTETRSFGDYFHAATGGAGKQFVLITDPGSALIEWGREEEAMALFLNQQDIGGRYSVLSFFGLVPATMIGLDVDELLERAEEAIQNSAASVPVAQNEALVLGVIMGELARAGRNKLTLIASPTLEPFGDWAEQLVAESTGKESQGTLPIVGERVSTPDVYGNDRLFVYLRLAGEAQHDEAVQALRHAGHPVVQLDLEDTYDLGAQFFSWEFATAIAGVVLGINPFDEPNVTESKNNSKRLLQQFEAEGVLPLPESSISEGGVGLSGSVQGDSVVEALQRFVDDVEPAQYIAIMAYVPMSSANEQALRHLQTVVRDRTKAATTLGFGPRFLHSTGQFHKGGPAQGVFIQIVSDDDEALEIPGRPYGFQTLVQAQALGDLEALQSREYPTLRISLRGDDVVQQVADLTSALQSPE